MEYHLPLNYLGCFDFLWYACLDLETVKAYSSENLTRDIVK